MFDPTHRDEYGEHLKRVIANFERVRANLLKRRRGASDSMMGELDERLAVNARTLEALRRSLELVKQDTPAASDSLR